MENFNLVKYLRENHLGPHSILGGYVDLHALKEVEDNSENNEFITLDYYDHPSILIGFTNRSIATFKRFVRQREELQGQAKLLSDLSGLDKIVFKLSGVTADQVIKSLQDLEKEEEKNPKPFTDPTPFDILFSWLPEKGYKAKTNNKNSEDNEDGERFMEEDSTPKKKVALPKEGIFKDKGVAEKVASVYTTRGLKGVEVKKVGKEDANTWKIYVDPGQESMYEADYGNNQPVDEVPYGDGEGRLDGFGDEFDQVDPVEEANGDYYDDNEDPFAGMQDNDDRFAGLGGDQIKAAIKNLMDDGFDTREIAQFVVDTIRGFKSFKR